MSEAHGEYLYFIDGDDVLRSDALEILYNTSKANNLDLLSFSGDVFFDDVEIEKLYKREKNFYIRKGNYPKHPVAGVELFSEYMRNFDFSGNLVFQFMRREYIQHEECIAIDGIRYGESPLAIYLTAQRAMCIPDRLYLRRFRSGSDITTPYNQTKIESMIIQYDFDLSFFRIYAGRCLQYSKWILTFLNGRFKKVVELCNTMSFTLENATLLQSFPTAAYLYERVIRNLDYLDLNCNHLTREVVERLHNEETIIVYGNGQVSQYVQQKLNAEGITDYILATTIGEKGKPGQRKVYGIDELYDVSDEAVVIIAVGDANKQDVIKPCTIKPLIILL